MAKIIKLKESDIEKLVSKIIKEDGTASIGRSYPSDMEELKYDFERDLNSAGTHISKFYWMVDEIFQTNNEVIEHFGLDNLLYEVLNLSSEIQDVLSDIEDELEENS
jgi:hypothetical protein